MIEIMHRAPGDGFTVGLDDAIRASGTVLPGMHLHPTRGKMPVVEWGRLSTADPAARRELARVPHDGWGMACKPSGVLAVDLDQHDAAADGFASWVRLLEGWRGPQPGAVGATPAAGRHLWFTNPEGWPGLIGILPGVDLRGAGHGDGSQIVISGRGRHLRILGALTPPPSPLADLMRDRLRVAPRVAPPLSLRVPMSGRVAGLARRVANAPEGQRNATLHWAACRIDDIAATDGATADEIASILLDAAAASGLETAAAAKTIASGRKPR